MAVSEDDRRPPVALGLPEREQRLLRVGPRRTSPPLPGAWTWRPAHRCSSRPRCRGPGCSRPVRGTGHGPVRRSRCRKPSRPRPRSRCSVAPGARPPTPAPWPEARRWPPAASAARSPGRAGPGSPTPSPGAHGERHPRTPARACRATCPAGSRTGPGGCRRKAGTRSRTRRCPRTGNSTTPAPAPPGSRTRGLSAGCPRRWTSNRWRSRRSRGRRRAGR